MCLNVDTFTLNNGFVKNDYISLIEWRSDLVWELSECACCFGGDAQPRLPAKRPASHKSKTKA